MDVLLFGSEEFGLECKVAATGFLVAVVFVAFDCGLSIAERPEEEADEVEAESPFFLLRSVSVLALDIGFDPLSKVDDCFGIDFF